MESSLRTIRLKTPWAFYAIHEGVPYKIIGQDGEYCTFQEMTVEEFETFRQEHLKQDESLYCQECGTKISVQEDASFGRRCKNCHTTVKHEHTCGVCGRTYVWTSEEIDQAYEESAFLPCGDRWYALDKPIKRSD
jgi:hypothetical protein